MSFVLSEAPLLRPPSVLGKKGPCSDNPRSVLWRRFTVSSWSLPENGGPFIDQIYVLQSYAEGWKEGPWEEKVDERPCLDPPLYSQDKHEYYRYDGEPCL